MAVTDTCSFKFFVKVLSILWVACIVHAMKRPHHKMPQEVAYKRLKTVENYKTIYAAGQKVVACSHLQEVFTYKEIFGVLDRRSLMGGGHTWSCDCNDTLQGTSTCTAALQVDYIC